jgi:UDP-glucose 4-epimerase
MRGGVRKAGMIQIDETERGRAAGRSDFDTAGSPLRESRVVVTGGAGFLGSHIVDQLLAAGCREIVVVDNFVRGRRDNLAHLGADAPVKLIEADIRQHRRLDEIVRGSDIVFHLATIRSRHCAIQPRQAFEVMVQATFDLMEICVAHHVRRLVVASSAAVYGGAADIPTPEECPPYANRTLYGAAKLFAEGLLRAFNETRGFGYVALRYFNVYGPRMDVCGLHTDVFVRWMERIAGGLRPVIAGDGRETLDLVHVRDAARAGLLAATRPVGDVVLNIGSGRETSLHDLAMRLARAMGREDLLPDCRPRGVDEPPRRCADIAAARRLLGYAPAVDLDDGLADLVAWWRAEQATNTLAAGAAAQVPAVGIAGGLAHAIATVGSEHHVP